LYQWLQPRQLVKHPVDGYLALSANSMNRGNVETALSKTVLQQVFGLAQLAFQLNRCLLDIHWLDGAAYFYDLLPEQLNFPLQAAVILEQLLDALKVEV
jgi:hypothetical protein